MRVRPTSLSPYQVALTGTPAPTKLSTATSSIPTPDISYLQLQLQNLSNRFDALSNQLASAETVGTLSSDVAALRREVTALRQQAYTASPDPAIASMRTELRTLAMGLQAVEQRLSTTGAVSAVTVEQFNALVARVDTLAKPTTSDQSIDLRFAAVEADLTAVKTQLTQATVTVESRITQLNTRFNDMEEALKKHIEDYIKLQTEYEKTESIVVKHHGEDGSLPLPSPSPSPSPAPTGDTKYIILRGIDGTVIYCLSSGNKWVPRNEESIISWLNAKVYSVDSYPSPSELK